jgi:hypothetical protein
MVHCGGVFYVFITWLAVRQQVDPYVATPSSNLLIHLLSDGNVKDYWFLFFCLIVSKISGHSGSRRLSENGYFSQSLRQTQIIILEIL